MRPSDSSMRLASLSASGSLFGMPSLTDLTNTSSPLCTLLFSIFTFPSMYPAQNAYELIGLLVDFCLQPKHSARLEPLPEIVALGALTLRRIPATPKPYGRSFRVTRSLPGSHHSMLQTFR